jgi:hypothetical protein
MSAVFLSTRDTEMLTRYKWRYTLEHAGFTRAEACRILFLRMLRDSGAWLPTAIPQP